MPNGGNLLAFLFFLLVLRKFCALFELSDCDETYELFTLLERRGFGGNLNFGRVPALSDKFNLWCESSLESWEFVPDECIAIHLNNL
jgi:hypothetical protein